MRKRASWCGIMERIRMAEMPEVRRGFRKIDLKLCHVKLLGAVGSRIMRAGPSSCGRLAKRC
jgi:hypothetical protein